MKKDIHIFFSGFCGGILSCIIINPIDIYKINRQIIQYKKINPYRGITASLLRESFSTGTYFSTYHYLMNLFDSSSKWSPFLSGGFAGIAAWTINYPIDVAKTRIMAYKANTLLEALRMGNLWKGIWFCWTRAFIVNGCGFFVFEMLKNS